jgi:hypothetical protein
VFVTLGIQHAIRMRGIMSSVACLVVSYFSTLSHKRQDFREKKWQHKNFLYNFCLLRKIRWDIIINVQRASSYSCQILIKLEIYRKIFVKYSNINFHENPSSGSRVVPCERRTNKQTWQSQQVFFEILRTRQKNWALTLAVTTSSQLNIPFLNSRYIIILQYKHPSPRWSAPRALCSSPMRATSLAHLVICYHRHFPTSAISSYAIQDAQLF